MRKEKYYKPAITVGQQIHLLQARGLYIEDVVYAKKCLESVGYYRLSGYCKPFQKANHIFLENASFNQIWKLYCFDKELRFMTSDAIEVIEIAFRANISNYMSINFGPFWYTDKQLFKTNNFHDSFIQQTIRKICKDKKEVFINHFYTNYSDQYPPSWMIMECLSFGSVVLIFKDLKSMQHKKNIAHLLGYHSTLIESWMEPLCYTRNICAHHSRLWNRWFVLRPQLPIKLSLSRPGLENSFNEQALIITLLIKTIFPEYLWRQKLYTLLKKYPTIPKLAMGFDSSWQEDRIWAL